MCVPGDTCVPQVFFNSRHVGGSGEIEEREREGVLGDKVKVCLEGDGEGETFPPSLKTPSPEEYVEVRREHLMQVLKCPIMS